MERTGSLSVSVSTQESRLELRPIEQLLEQQGVLEILSPTKSMITTQCLSLDYTDKLAAVLAARGEPSTLPSLREANQSMSVISSIYGIK